MENQEKDQRNNFTAQDFLDVAFFKVVFLFTNDMKKAGKLPIDYDICNVEAVEINVRKDDKDPETIDFLKLVEMIPGVKINYVDELRAPDRTVSRDKNTLFVNISGKNSQSTFRMIKNGTAFNEFNKLSGKGRGVSKDAFTGKTTIVNPKKPESDYKLDIVDYSGMKNLRTTTHQLLTVFMNRLNDTGCKSNKVTISLQEYMYLRGLQNEDEAREQVKDDLNLLFHSYISFTERGKTGKPRRSFSEMRVIDYIVIKNNIIGISFGSVFFELLTEYPVMPYPVRLLSINSNDHPNSFYFGTKISEHKNMNYGKPNENIISVESLLKSTPNIPSYDEVMKGNRNINDRIITPFERDMDALDDVLSWNYCHSGGEFLTDEELKKFDYDIFKDLLIFIRWRSYPDQTKRIEKAKKQNAAMKKAQKKTSSPKK